MNRKAERLLACLAQAPPGVVVEVGAVRFRHEVATDGYSTVHLSRACQASQRRFYSLEGTVESAALANDILRSNGLPEAVVAADAVWTLHGLRNVALLYLDGSDDPCAALDQFLATNFRGSGLVVIDDCHDYDGHRLGKGTHVAEWLTRHSIAYELVDTEPGYKMLSAKLPAGVPGRTSQVDGVSPLRINLITNIDNGVGLERDARLLQGVLCELGHEPALVHYEKTAAPPPADLSIFLEVLVERFMKAAPRNWMIPNPEWWYWNHLAPRFEWILAKTLDGYARFRTLSERVVYTGFLSEDRYAPDVPREQRFLHVAGKSTYKNTRAVIEAWRTYGFSEPLTVVAQHRLGESTRNLEFLDYLPDEQLRRIQNSHLFHVCPSQYEGWGHYLHEALSVGAVIIATDAPPLSDFGTPPELRVPPSGTYQELLATMRPVTAAGVALAVERCLALTEDRLHGISQMARATFLRQRPEFLSAINRLLRTRPPGVILATRK